MLSTRVKLEIAAVIVVLLVLAAIGGSWLAAREDGIRLKATLEAQNGVIAEAGKREAAREAALKDSLAQLEDLKKRTQAPQDVVRQLPRLLPLPQPITLSVAGPASQRAGTDAALPAAPVAQMPVEDLKPLFDFAADCKACQARLAASDAARQDDAVKLKAVTIERDAAVKAAKGGGKWASVRTAAKWLLIGGAIGYAAHR